MVPSSLSRSHVIRVLQGVEIYSQQPRDSVYALLFIGSSDERDTFFISSPDSHIRKTGQEPQRETRRAINAPHEFADGQRRCQSLPATVRSVSTGEQNLEIPGELLRVNPQVTHQGDQVIDFVFSHVYAF